MSAFDSHQPRRLSVVAVIVLILVAVLAAAAYFLAPRFERDAPQISVTPNADVLGLAPMEITVTDQGAGLRSVNATLSAGGKEIPLAAEQYAEPVKEKKITIAA